MSMCMYIYIVKDVAHSPRWIQVSCLTNPQAHLLRLFSVPHGQCSKLPLTLSRCLGATITEQSIYWDKSVLSLLVTPN